MDRLLQRLHELLWPEQPPRSAVRAKALAVAQFAYALIRDLLTGELSLRATSLVYTTMLSLVPLLAFSFSVLKGLGLHRQIEPLLSSFLAGLGPRADEISARIIGFVDNVSGSVLASISIVALLLAALQMAQIVESSLNFVWRVDRPRSLARRFSQYLSVMLIGPLLMSVAMGVIATVSSTALMNRLRQIEPIGAWLSAIGSIMPYVLIVAAFTTLYLVVPNARVRLKPALGGGLFAGVVWTMGGNLFASLVVGASRWQAVYSGFAIVLIAMLWLYLSWLILLLGAQLAFYLQNPAYLPLGQRSEEMSNSLRERLALSTMLLIGRDFVQPDHGWRTESLAARIRVPRYLLEPVMAALDGAELLTETTEQRLIPAKDPRHIRVIDILRAVRGPRTGVLGSDMQDWNSTVAAVSSRLDDAIESAVRDRTLADLIDEDLAADESARDENESAD
jgi:membrane protein